MLKNFWTDLINLEDPLLNTRQKAWERFESIGMPNRKMEAFRYVTTDWVFSDLAQKKEPQGEKKEGIVLVDGFFAPERSSLPSEIIVKPIRQAINSYALFLQNRISKTIEKEQDPLALLNGAFQGEGVFIYVPPKCKAALHVHQIYDQKAFSNPRIHLFLGRDASLKIEQSSDGEGEKSNLLFDFVADAGSNLELIDRANGTFQSVRGTLKQKAQFKGVFLGKMVRQSIEIELSEENADASIYGLSTLKEKEEGHFHVLMHHSAPSARSNQHFKSIVKDESKFSFEGKIYVEPQAQKTESYQLNNNLILSDFASANAKPNLEIFADDVKASHGATFGRLNEEELFYLCSRGIDQNRAKELLLQGFCKEITDHAR